MPKKGGEVCCIGLGASEYSCITYVLKISRGNSQIDFGGQCDLQCEGMLLGAAEANEGALWNIGTLNPCPLPHGNLGIEAVLGFHMPALYVGHAPKLFYH